MPRLPFPRSHRALAFTTTTVFSLIGPASLTSTALAAPPSPVITAMATRGQAPFAVHVHALNTTLNAGDQSTARYEWTFGDPSGRYNALVGWNAAHIYDVPGTYTVSLKVTNQNREVATRTLQVIIDPPVRTAIYISPSGSDTNSGTSPGAPLRTLDRAQDFMGDNKAFHLQRGATFNGSGLSTGNQNVLISAYGSGADPVIRFQSSTPYTKIIQVKDAARNVVIENITFDSIFTPSNTIVRGMEVRGTNVTVRNCRFLKVSDAINTGGGGAFGLLTQDNICAAIGSYYIWIQGSDHTHLGNVVAESVDEHNMRLGGASRVLIAYNDLTNADKSSIWCMLGDHCSIVGNKLRQGRLITGPNHAVVYSNERFRHVVAEGNEFFEAKVIMYDGSENITLRNNVMHESGLEAISIWGASASRGRTTRNIAVHNNTVINNSSGYGRFLGLGDGAENVSILNNIYAAPYLNGSNGGNVIVDDASLSGHISRNNVWANPQTGSRWHGLNGASLSATAWNTLAQTSFETHRTFLPGDLAAGFLPTFNAAVGTPVAGVMVDFHGEPRPASGPWIVGAVSSASGATGLPGDVNGDGIVNVSDLLGVITYWGGCPACAADLNGDGVVNVSDLLAVISIWN